MLVVVGWMAGSPSAFIVLSTPVAGLTHVDLLTLARFMRNNILSSDFILGEPKYYINFGASPK